MTKIFIVRVLQLNAFTKIQHTLVQFRGASGYRQHFINVTRCRLVKLFVCAFRGEIPVTKAYSTPPNDIRRPRYGMVTEWCFVAKHSKRRPLLKGLQQTLTANRSTSRLRSDRYMRFLTIIIVSHAELFLCSVSARLVVRERYEHDSWTSNTCRIFPLSSAALNKLLRRRYRYG